MTDDPTTNETTDLGQMRTYLESLAREGKLVDRFIGALGLSGQYDGVTKEEALSATRRFAQMVEKSAK